MKGLGNLSKREIVSLFFLTTEFLSFKIQDNNKKISEGEKHSSDKSNFVHCVNSVR